MLLQILFLANSADKTRESAATRTELAAKCTSEFLIIDNGKVTGVGKKAICVAIPDTVTSLADGSIQGWIFKEASATVTEIDFSNAKNLKTIGKHAFYSCTHVTKFDLSACKMLTDIGIGAFRECTGATSIILPESPLTYIPGSCFYECTSLASFTVPSNIEIIKRDDPDHMGAFSLCTNLKTFTFAPNSKCTTISGKVFMDSGIETISLPKSVNQIDGWTFRIANSLRSIEVDQENQKYVSYDGVLYTKDKQLIYYPPLATQGEIAQIKEGTEAIHIYSFVGVRTYKGVDIPNTVTSIHASAFYDFDSLLTATIPASVTSMSHATFQDCTGLTNVTFLNQMESIPYLTFYRCVGLTVFSIPKGVSILEREAFKDCKGLKTVYIPNTVKTYHDGVFKNCPSDIELVLEEGSEMVYTDKYLYTAAMDKLVMYLGSKTTVTIKSTVNTIIGAAFQNRPINKVEYEDINNVTLIQGSAFDSCTDLKEITLPPKIKYITTFMFSKSGLVSISIPPDVKEIENNAFDGCKSLTTVTFQSDTTLKIVGEEAFNECFALSTIVFPKSVEELHDHVFLGCRALRAFKLPSSLKHVGTSVFYNTNIESFTYDSDIVLERMNNSCINYCLSLQSFTVPNSVTSLADYSISYCNALETIYFGTGLVTVSDYAISNCDKLRKVIIGTNHDLVSLTARVFYECPKLVEIDTTGENNFDFEKGMLLSRDRTILFLFLKATNPVEVVVPETVIKILMYAFSECTSLVNVTIPGFALTEIQLSAFEDCTSLKNIKLPGSLKILGTSVFNNCNLTRLHIGHTNIVEIKDNDFSNNKYLNTIILPDTLEICSEIAFKSTGIAPKVFYFGTNVIDHDVSLSKFTKVYGLDTYPQSTYLTFRVITRFQFDCIPVKKKLPKVSLVSSTAAFFLISTMCED